MKCCAKRQVQSFDKKGLITKLEPCKKPALADSKYCLSHHYLDKKGEKMYDNSENILRRLTPEDSRDLAILAATESAARGRRVTKQELAARFIREGLDRAKVEVKK